MQALGQVGVWGDGGAAAVRGGPDQDAGFGLGEVPAAGLFGAVMPPAQRRQITLAGGGALVVGEGVVQVAAGGGAAASGEGAGPLPGADQVLEPVRRVVSGTLAEGAAGPAFEPVEPQPGQPRLAAPRPPPPARQPARRPAGRRARGDGRRVWGSRPASRATNTAARNWSRVPGAPASLSARAIAVIRLSAATASAAGSSRPARPAFPEPSGQASTRAWARPCSARRRAAAGSSHNTMALSAARSCPVVIDPPIPANPIAAAAAAISPSPASPAANPPPRARSIRPSSTPFRTAGRRARSRARP